MAFDGKVIAITGAASGMGLATAKLLASRGAIISLADLNEEGLKKAVASLSGNKKHIYKVIDVRDSSSVTSWIQYTLQELGKLDGAVNMAGVLTSASPVVGESDENWDFIFSVNTKGVFNCIRAEIKAMESGGSIVSAASVYGQIGAAGYAAYCASKAAVIALTRTAARENQHIRLNCVAPGSVNTPMGASEKSDDIEHQERGNPAAIQRRRAEPVEIANVIAFLLSDEASFVTGAVYNVDGGWVC